MPSSLEGRTVQTISLHKRRQAILGELAQVNRKIDTTQTQVRQLEQRIATLSEAKRNAA